jgi:uncharacterized protein YbjQ (UPF0145 family)
MTESNDPYQSSTSEAANPVSAPQPTTPSFQPPQQSQEVYAYTPAPPSQAPAPPSQAPVPASQAPVQGQYLQQIQATATSRAGAGLLVTTTDRIDGKKISSYLGVVAGEVVLGTSISKDIKGSVRGFVGGRSSSYEKEVRYARQQATLEMVQVAQQMGASAVVGVSFSYVTVNALVMVAATGTAVVLEDL